MVTSLCKISWDGYWSNWTKNITQFTELLIKNICSWLQPIYYRLSHSCQFIRRGICTTYLKKNFRHLINGLQLAFELLFFSLNFSRYRGVYGLSVGFSEEARNKLPPFEYLSGLKQPTKMSLFISTKHNQEPFVLPLYINSLILAHFAI